MSSARISGGPWRRRRRMIQALGKVDRLDARRIPRGAPVLRRVLSALAVAALVSAFALSYAHKQWGVALTADGLKVAHRLGRPPVITHDRGTFRFTMAQAENRSRPVAYDPCQPIDYQLNDTLAPRGGRRIVGEAIALVEEATGLRFRLVGRTDRLPPAGGTHSSSAREPVLIAWTTPRVVPELRGRTAGLGGSTAATDMFTRQLQYVTGGVTLDAASLGLVLDRPGGRAQVRAIVMHELGHLVGLDHVKDPNELMAEENSGRLEFGPGDRRGLAAVGSGRCFH